MLPDHSSTSVHICPFLPLFIHFFRPSFKARDEGKGPCVERIYQGKHIQITCGAQIKIFQDAFQIFLLGHWPKVKLMILVGQTQSLIQKRTGSLW